MFLWTDAVGSNTKRPAFNQFVHQIGVGLFPRRTLPLAFTDVLNPQVAPNAKNRILGISLTAWFVTAFLGPALGASYSHYAIFFKVGCRTRFGHLHRPSAKTATEAAICADQCLVCRAYRQQFGA